jgi:Spy/CpxP family protein refolding chaperone
MQKENKNVLLIWIIVILAVLNISTLVTIGIHVYQTRQAQKTATSIKQTETDAEKFSGRYFRDQLELTPDQMDKFRNFNRTFRQEARAITIDLSGKRKQMFEEMNKAAPDTTELIRLSQEIGDLHKQLKLFTFRYYLSIKEISTETQQQKLTMLFKDLFINDLQLNYPGKGNPKGKQHRKMFNN